jgi:NAD(P)-dependent dehydrogenase (short-subunit alcohol dehydrogenase family)
MQPWYWRLVGWLTITGDTLLQRVIDFGGNNSHALFRCATLAGANPLLEGKIAVVTGANTGLGLQTARWLAASGATVVLACRSIEKAKAAAAAVVSAVPDAIVEPASLDLSDPTSVREFAALYASGGTKPARSIANIASPESDDGNTGAENASIGTRPLHMLILNAGVMCVPQAIPETHFTVNHVAHAHLALLLLPNLAAGSAEPACHARIVFVSSITYLVSNLDLSDVHYARRQYRSFIAYANSKLCNVLFMRALAARLHGTGIICCAVHPGESTTDVARNLGSVWMTLHKRVGALFLLSPREAARTSVYAAASDEAAKVAGEPVFHAIDHTIDVPERLVSVEDQETLWEITMHAVGLRPDEQTKICAAGLAEYRPSSK